MVRTEEILKPVPEQSTCTFRVICKDETGTAVVPVSGHWDLSALDGTVIAYNQEITDLASTMYVTISGATTRILQDEARYGERLITFRLTYNSDRGNSLPLNKQIKFSIQNLKLIGYPLSLNIVDVVFTDDYLRDVGVA